MIALFRKITASTEFAIVACFFFGHSVFHFMGQSFSVLLPSIQETFAITPVQIGALITTREIVAGLISLPGGILSDYLSRYRAQILAISLAAFAAGWLIIALSPYFLMVFAGMAIIAAASSIYHLPSLVELAARFPDRRGMIFAIHGAGGSIGDIFGPMATGLLLLYLSWRDILSLYIVLPLALALWTLLLFAGNRKQKDAAAAAAEEAEAAQPPQPTLAEQLRIARELMKSTQIWRINIVAGLRSMCFAVLVTFLPLFMHDSGFSPGAIGFHFGLLWAVGLPINPLMGYLSDRFGRKIVLVPALLYSSLMVALLAIWGTGSLFTLLIVLLGFSVRSDYSLINATIIDIVKSRAETTMLGVLSVSRYLMGASAPLIAGLLYQYIGMQATLLFVSALFLLAALVFASVDLGDSGRRSGP